MDGFLLVIWRADNASIKDERQKGTDGQNSESHCSDVELVPYRGVEFLLFTPIGIHCLKDESQRTIVKITDCHTRAGKLQDDSPVDISGEPMIGPAFHFLQ